jgi:hypothetical protein
MVAGVCGGMSERERGGERHREGEREREYPGPNDETQTFDIAVPCKVLVLLSLIIWGSMPRWATPTH